jgi:hypothetical protein
VAKYYRKPFDSKTLQFLLVKQLGLAISIGRGAARLSRGHCDLLQRGKGESALALSRDLFVSYKTTFVLLHKLREAKVALGMRCMPNMK